MTPRDESDARRSAPTRDAIDSSVKELLQKNNWTEQIRLYDHPNPRRPGHRDYMQLCSTERLPAQGRSFVECLDLQSTLGTDTVPIVIYDCPQQ